MGNREFLHHGEQHEYELEETLNYIDSRQPELMRLGTAKIIEYLNSHENK